MAWKTPEMDDRGKDCPDHEGCQQGHCCRQLHTCYLSAHDVQVLDWPRSGWTRRAESLLIKNPYLRRNSKPKMSDDHFIKVFYCLLVCVRWLIVFFSVLFFLIQSSQRKNRWRRLQFSYFFFSSYSSRSKHMKLTPRLVQIVPLEMLGHIRNERLELRPQLLLCCYVAAQYTGHSH